MDYWRVTGDLSPKDGTQLRRFSVKGPQKTPNKLLFLRARALSATLTASPLWVKTLIWVTNDGSMRNSRKASAM